MTQKEKFNNWLRELGDWVFENRKPIRKTAMKLVMGEDYKNNKLGTAFSHYIGSREGEAYFVNYLRGLKAKI